MLVSQRYVTHFATFDVMPTDSRMAGTFDIPVYMRNGYANLDQAPPFLGRESCRQ